MCFVPQRRATFRPLDNFWTSINGPNMWSFVHFHFQICFPPQRRALYRTLSTSQLPTVVRERRALPLFASKCASRDTGMQLFDVSPAKSGPNMVCLCMFTSICASRHNGVHFFDVSTSKSGPNMVCFDTFHFQMCFAPQRLALYRHLNFQNWSGHGVL